MLLLTQAEKIIIAGGVGVCKCKKLEKHGRKKGWWSIVSQSNKNTEQECKNTCCTNNDTTNCDLSYQWNDTQYHC